MAGKINNVTWLTGKIKNVTWLAGKISNVTWLAGDAIVSVSRMIVLGVEVVTGVERTLAGGSVTERS